MSGNRIIPLLILFCLIASAQAFAQLSPGDLASVHAHLEGTANCTKCHVLGDKVSNEKCLDCHKEIRVRVEADRGYHSSTGVKRKDCFLCHNDHHGRNFQIIRFDPDTFDHILAGYHLEGTHALIDCKKCHQPAYISDTELKKKERTYLGLNTACLSCHEDFHQGTLSKQCQDCHDFVHFSPASSFDHSMTAYNLNGAHKEIECSKCHKTEIRNGKEFTVYSGILFDNCTRCHVDVHENKFGQKCTECHTEESFHIIKNPGNIDHSQTAFPLLGKHRTVDCRACHKSSYTDPVAHTTCMDCHSDYHEGQFQKPGGSVDCSDCHDVYGYSPSLFTVERHRETRFPLEGAHMATPCFLCHKQDDTKKWEFREIGTDCIDCHEDIHKHFLEEKYYPDGACTNCHQVNRWNEITFDHKLTGYELEGAHKILSCNACHYTQNEDGQLIQQFTGLESYCLNCHDDIHYSQFQEYGAEGCLHCHGYDNWMAERFDHDNTNFKLDGKHRGLACALCHQEVTQDSIQYVLYKIEDYRCEACH